MHFFNFTAIESVRGRGSAALGFALAVAIAIAASAAPASGATLQQKLLAADGATRSALGYSVAIDGDTAVLGALGDDGSRGSVYVYARVGDSWVNTAKLNAPDGAAGDLFGRSVAIDGDTAVVGAPGDDSNRGAAYVYARSGGSWASTAKLTASDGSAGDNLGVAVAIDGDTIVAGAYGDDFGAIADQGSAYTFARTGAAARTQTAKLLAADGAQLDQLGLSVDIDGDTIVAGSWGDDVGTQADQGSAYTFARTGAAARVQTAKLTASDGAAIDRLGFSVAIDGDVIVAGAFGDQVGTHLTQGSVYSFASTGETARTETAKLTASDGADGDELGFAVAIDGDTIVAGAPGDDIGANGSQGTAYGFARTGAAAPTETAKLTASDGAAGDDLGLSVAVDGDAILAGAPGDTFGMNASQGSASVFFDPTPPPPPPDTTAPALGLTAKRAERAGKAIKVTVSCDEACTVALTGTAKAGDKRNGELKPRTVELAAGETERVKLKLGRKLRTTLVHAGRGKAMVSATATDAAGNVSAPERAKVRLRRAGAGSPAGN